MPAALVEASISFKKINTIITLRNKIVKKSMFLA
jgi:hypothetical protein